MFTRAKIGGWATHEKLTSAQQNQLDIDHANAIDGAGGSAGTPYTPSTTILVGGSGLYNVELTNIAALKAIDTTSLSTGEMRQVIGLGRYRLDKGTGASDTEDQPLVVSPTTGTGRWFALDNSSARQYFKQFLSGTTSWTCPRNLAFVELEIVGGGAGGGAGTAAGTTGNATGGGGGGAGKRFHGVVATTPTNVESAVVGAGGTGGAAPGGNGTSGGDSSILGVGAPGGQSSQGTSSSTTAVMVPGGLAGQRLLALRSPMAVTGLTSLHMASGDGGFSQTPGASQGSSSAGATSNEGFVGGAAGTNGTIAGGDLGGVGGGGGGGGPGGVGAAGGNGGNGNNAGAGAAGSVGSNASANTGAGGGGGGGGGTGSASGGNGGNGGNGGSGYIIIRGVAIVTSYV